MLIATAMRTAGSCKSAFAIRPAPGVTGSLLWASPGPLSWGDVGRRPGFMSTYSLCDPQFA